MEPRKFLRLNMVLASFQSQAVCIIHKMVGRGLFIFVLLGLALAQSPEVRVTVDRNAGKDATREFKFKNVPSPAKDDAGSHATIKLIVGRADPNSAPLSALNDGRLPESEDEPAANFFFNAGGDGGRLLFDLGSTLEIAQVNTYSWHSGSRAPQLYNLFASDGSGAGFNPEPDGRTDPATCGWKLIATVDTRPKGGEPGGQYGVSVSSAIAGGSLGKFRYVLFDVVPTEADDPWGNTFFSEIDIVEKPYH